MRLLAFTDYVYHQVHGVVYGERAFALFIAALGEQVDGLTVVGRLDPSSQACHYALPEGIRFVGLPHYASLTNPVAVGRSLLGSLRRYWRALDEADAAWLLGPYPHAVAFALLTRLRGRRLVLGVRQDFPTYVRSRRPGRRWMHISADALELAWRRLARRAPVVVVGSELARHYQHAPSLLQISVSLIRERDVAEGVRAAERSYEGPLQVLSVGRIDREKNPLLLAAILERLRERDPRWHLIVCGEGPLSGELERELDRRGLSDHVTLRGYVPIDAGLLDLYRSSHAFLHVSLTEGMPQVLLEAFASGVPVVATEVGGVPDAAGGAALLIAPADSEAAAQALARIAGEQPLRQELISEGLDRARRQTLEREVARVAAFVSSPGDGSLPIAAAAPHTPGG